MNVTVGVTFGVFASPVTLLISCPCQFEWWVWKACLRFIRPPPWPQVNISGGGDWPSLGHLQSFPWDLKLILRDNSHCPLIGWMDSCTDPFSQEEKKGSLQWQTEGNRCIEESRKRAFWRRERRETGMPWFLAFLSILVLVSPVGWLHSLPWGCEITLYYYNALLLFFVP